VGADNNAGQSFLLMYSFCKHMGDICEEEEAGGRLSTEE
jgi:hypothetical protein